MMTAIALVNRSIPSQNYRSFSVVRTSKIYSLSHFQGDDTVLLPWSPWGTLDPPNLFVL